MPLKGLGLFVLLIVAIVAANIYLLPQYAWVSTGVLIIGLMMMAGWGVNRRPDGILIDNRNRVSLSKFQAAAWTILVLSALVSAVALNLFNADPTPIDIQITNALLAAMGISATSLVATPALLSLKAAEAPTAQDVQKADVATVTPSSSGMEPAGKVFARSDPKDASWADIFRGDEVGNVASPDLSKIQQFLITMVLLGVYAAAIWTLLGKAKTVDSLPVVSDQFIWFLAISHAGYLVYKAAPHSRSAGPAPTPTPAPAPAVSPPPPPAAPPGPGAGGG